MSLLTYYVTVASLAEPSPSGPSNDLPWTRSLWPVLDPLVDHRHSRPGRHPAAHTASLHTVEGNVHAHTHTYDTNPVHLQVKSSAFATNPFVLFCVQSTFSLSSHWTSDIVSLNSAVISFTQLCSALPYNHLIPLSSLLSVCPFPLLYPCSSSARLPPFLFCVLSFPCGNCLSPNPLSILFPVVSAHPSTLHWGWSVAQFGFFKRTEPRQHYETEYYRAHLEVQPSEVERQASEL